MPRLNSSGQRAGAGRPAELAGEFARRHDALYRRRERADHHEWRDDAGADNLRLRHRDAAANLDRLAVPIKPAVVVDRQPAEIGHVDRMDVAALRLGFLRLGVRRGVLRWLGRQQIEDVVVRIARFRIAGARIGLLRIACRLRRRSRSSLVQARVDKRPGRDSLRAMFPGSRAEVKARAARGRVP